MKLSEYKDEQALDVLAEIIEPAAYIMADPEIRAKVKIDKEKDDEKSKTDVLGIVKIILKKHKKEIIEILAAVDGVPVEEYHCNVFTLPVKIIELLNDKELIGFFTSQASMEDASASIAPTVNTEENEQ